MVSNSQATRHAMAGQELDLPTSDFSMIKINANLHIFFRLCAEREKKKKLQQANTEPTTLQPDFIHQKHYAFHTVLLSS